MQRAECISGYASSDGVESATFDNQQQALIGGLQKRRMSRSEPTLDIPKFHIGGHVDDDAPIMTRVLSGLFESDSAYHTPYNLSTNDLRTVGETSSISTDVFLSPTSIGGINSIPLRKSSSAVDWSLTNEQQQQMSTTNNQSKSMSPDTNKIASPTITTNANGLTAAVAAAVQSAQHDHHHGGIFNLFSRGFLAKPVIRSEEETYRYLMAFDR